MPNKKEQQIMKKILSQSITESEKEELCNLGIDFKKPTKLTVLLASLYKKGTTGDLNAIKEIRNIVFDSKTTDDTKVIIIDNVRDKDG